MRLSGLRAALKEELARAAPNAPNTPRHLVALIELGKLEASARQCLLAGYAPGADKHAETPAKSPPLRAHSLFLAPEFAELVPYGPMLITHTEGADALLDALGDYDSSTVSAWIVSVLPVAELARYLSNFTRARPPIKSMKSVNDDRYILRFYDSKILPRLRELTHPTWWPTLFKPITQWWTPLATPQAERWQRITGEGKQPEPELFQGPRWLFLTEEVWEALEGDPLPYKLTDVLQQQAPDLFESDCYGVRVAQVETLLAEAREQGLQSEDDFLIYIWCVMAQPTIRQDARWRETVQRAAEAKTPLNLPEHWNKVA